VIASEATGSKVFKGTYMQPAEIIAFKDLLRAKFPLAHAVKLPAGVTRTGLACLDAMGWGAGSICEIVSAQASSGTGLLLVALIEGKNEASRQPVALVDGADGFDPASVSHEVLEQLLWVRCREVAQAVQAADLLLRDGNMPRVLLDLQGCPAHAVRQVPAHVWHRLRLLAEKSGAALCAFTSFQTVPCARSRLVLEHPHALEAMDLSREALLSALQGRVTRGRQLPEGLTLAAAS
jgi:hypothetical protein